MAAPFNKFEVFHEPAQLEIKDFLVIKSASISISGVNLFIGEQAAGKSILAKLIYFFKDALAKVPDYWVKAAPYGDFSREMTAYFYMIFPKNIICKNDFFAKYTVGEYTLEVSRDAKFTFKTNSDFQKSYRLGMRSVARAFDFLNKNDGDKGKNNKQHVELVSFVGKSVGVLLRSMSSMVPAFGALGFRGTMFVPATRSIVTLLEKNVFSIYNKLSSDIILNDFGVIYENSKTFFSNKSFMNKRHEGAKKNALAVVREILKGDFLVRDGKEYIVRDGVEVDLNYTSSGQQAALPLVVALLSGLLFDVGQTFTVIEEPEAHLFPDSQYSIVRFVGGLYNTFVGNASYVVTTHSPYVLAAFNNLIAAGKLGEERLKALPRGAFLAGSALKMGTVSAYFVSNGFVKSIISDETGLVDADCIDGVSGKIAEDFSAILEAIYDL